MDPILVLLLLIRGALRDRIDLDAENLTLRQQLEVLSMPADYGVGLHHGQGGTPVRPEPGKPRPKHSILRP